MISFSHKERRGFTLVEMLVALSLFTIVITISVGAFLSLIGASKGVQEEQSIMATLTFVLDSMTREIRTGTSYYCDSGSFSNQESLASTSRNCEDGSTGVSFLEAGSSITGASNRIGYYYEQNTGTIYRRIGNTAAESIVADGITITDAQFFVTGSRRLGPAAAFVGQPVVTIILEARDETGATTTLQTTVTQRELDI